MGSTKGRAVAFAIGVHLVRFGVIMLGLTVAPLLGIEGWYIGLFANVLCSMFAAALVTYLRLWRRIGFLTLWRGPLPVIVLLLPLAEAVLRIFPIGLEEQAPGFGLWALTLLLVGFNEELISRGVVLETLRGAFSAMPAVVITASLFGLQHLSAFATTGRDAYDIPGNVLASATYGFALAAFQYRYAWIWPLIIVHALADFTSILTRTLYDDLFVAVTCIAFVVYGVLMLRGVRASEEQLVNSRERSSPPRTVRG